MNENFADWYKKADINPSSDTLEARWSGVEECLDGLEVKKLGFLLKLYYDIGKCGEEELGEFKKIFKEKDSTFLMKDNENELRVLAGTVLCCAVKSDSRDRDVAITISHSVISNEIFWKNGDGLNDDLLKYARDFIFDESKSSRDKRIRNKFIDQKIIAAKLEEIQAHTHIPQIKEVLEAYKTGFFRLSEALSDTKKALDSRKEESGVLWWLFGEYGNSIEKSFFEMKLEAVVGLPYDLYQLTNDNIGVFSAFAFLKKGLSLTKVQKEEVSIFDVLKSDGLKLFELSVLEQSSEYCYKLPLLDIFSRSKKSSFLETADKYALEEFSIDINKEIPVCELACELYRELIINWNFIEYE